MCGGIAPDLTPQESLALTRICNVFLVKRASKLLLSCVTPGLHADALCDALRRLANFEDGFESQLNARLNRIGASVFARDDVLFVLSSAQGIAEGSADPFFGDAVRDCFTQTRVDAEALISAGNTWEIEVRAASAETARAINAMLAPAMCESAEAVWSPMVPRDLVSSVARMQPTALLCGAASDLLRGMARAGGETLAEQDLDRFCGIYHDMITHMLPCLRPEAFFAEPIGA
ncbi:hypothetical protein JKP88DRAFT_272996 [Tribonema minus]|uniref:Uncharacterized protein n=1 Tax=Tribonema minus TaxID=303371 RepID=A0A835YYF7_9STRA|nr:hypothetical protein JKP88DRAFT_272996 [Tribonema minus]